MATKARKITFKSGDGESWIEDVYDVEIGDDNKIVKGSAVKVELTEEEQDELEAEHHHIIWEHDHDRHTGYGAFIVTDTGHIRSQ